VNVMILEIILDWTKHAFITRFNEINLSVYSDYLLSFAYDTAQSYNKKVKRLGLFMVCRVVEFILKKNHFVL